MEAWKNINETFLKKHWHFNNHAIRKVVHVTNKIYERIIVHEKKWCIGVKKETNVPMKWFEEKHYEKKGVLQQTL